MWIVKEKFSIFKTEKCLFFPYPRYGSLTYYQRKGKKKKKVIPTVKNK